MSQIFVPSFNPALNVLGLQAPAAKMAFYLSGTNTLATVYDENGDPLDQSPNVHGTVGVAADITGRFPQIYFGDEPAYRVVLRTAQGAQIGNEADPYTNLEAFITGLVDDLIADLGSDTGAGMVDFTQSPSPAYGGGSIGLKLQNDLRLQDKPFSTPLDGASNAVTGFAAAVAKAQLTRGTVKGTRGGIARLDTTLTLTGPQIAFVGEDSAAAQNNGTLPAFTIRGNGTGPVVSIDGMSGSVWKNFAIESTGTNDIGMKFANGTAMTIEGIQAYNWGSIGHRFDKLFSTETSGFGYAQVRRLNVLSTACAVVFHCGKADGDPTQFMPPWSVEYCHEFAALDGMDMTIVKVVQNRLEYTGFKRNTANSYSGTELCILDTRQTDAVWEASSLYSCGIFDCDGTEIDHGGRTTARSFYAYNLALLRLNACTISGGAIKAIADVYNSKVKIGGVTAASIDGPICNLLDLESMVSVETGNSLVPGNTGGFFNPTVALAGPTITCATISGSRTITVTGTTSTIYPGMPISDGAVRIPANTVILYQSGGPKGGGTVSAPATYVLSDVCLSTGSTSATQPTATYPVNSGIYHVPRYVDGATNYYFIETWRADNGVHKFKITVTDNAAFTVMVSSFFLSTGKPLSYRTLGKPLYIEIENRSGGVLGAITFSGMYLSGTPTPADTKSLGFTVAMDVAISGTTVTEYFKQVGAYDAAIPNGP